MRSIKTLLLTLSALALAFSGALAQGREHGGGRHEGGGHGGAGYTAPGRGGYAPHGDSFPRSVELRNGARAGYEGARGYAPNPYEPQPYARGRVTTYPEAPYLAPQRSFRRGQYIPHAYWGGEITNPRSRHLRTPPPGYEWIGVGPNAYLMQRSTGLVLDSVPGAW